MLRDHDAATDHDELHRSGVDRATVEVCPERADRDAHLDTRRN